MLGFLYRVVRLRASFLEQISVSAGSFVFFMLLARLLGPSDFGLFALHLVPAQIIHSVAMQWILLPITTTLGEWSPTQFRRRLALLIVAAPPFSIAYGMIAGIDSGRVTFTFVVTAVSAALVLFDFARYFAIRLNWVALQIASNLVRWLTSFVLVIAGAHWAATGTMTGVIAFVGGILAGLIVVGVPIARELGGNPKDNTLKVNQNQKSGSGALLSLGLTNAVFTLISSTALARANLAAFGAIQVFRSLVNWAPLILQYLETHFAASLARSGRTTFADATWPVAFLAAGVVGEAVIILYGKWILSNTVGAEFAVYLWLFAVMYALVLVQSYTRAIGIEVRLSGAIVAIWMQVGLLALASAIIAIWMWVAETSISTVAAITVMSVTAVIQAIAMKVGLRIHRRISAGR